MIPTRPLGRTGIDVPQICLGTMTYGSQNTEAEGHGQMDMAMDHGVTFFDTAEAYSAVPMSAETQGRTEEIIGTWFKKTGRRRDVILATKIAGTGVKYIRDGAPVSGSAIREAVEGSLKRMQTDYIDLYQIHWPNRGHYHFRRNWLYDPTNADADEVTEHIIETLRTLGDLVIEGKIRSIGLSNETAWGTMRFVELAEANGLPRVASIQNEYSLMCRMFDTDLAEVSHHEDVGLFAYSPLATGLLSGKYSGGVRPEGSRGSINTDLGGRMSERALAIADKYVELARDHGLDPVQMAIAFCMTRPFMMSVIIGATKDAQLETVFGAASVTLSEEVMDGIDQIHRANPMPY